MAKKEASEIIAVISLAGRPWEVRKTQNLHDSGDKCAGLTSCLDGKDGAPAKRWIEIEANLSPDEAWAAYIHEVGHAMLYAYHRKVNKWGDEEEFCCTLEEAIPDALKPFPNFKLW